VENIQIWVMKGTTYRTSRYWTFNAESHSPTASDVTSDSKRKIGALLQPVWADDRPPLTAG